MMISLYQEGRISCKTSSVFPKGRDNSCNAWAPCCNKAQSFSSETAAPPSPEDWFDFPHDKVPLLRAVALGLECFALAVEV